MHSGTPDVTVEAGTAPLAGGMVAAAVAALTVIPLVTIIGRLTQQWAPPTGDVFRIVDASAYGALLGLAVGAAIAAADLQRAPTLVQRLDAATAFLAPALAGAATFALCSTIAVVFDVTGGTTAGMLTYLLRCVAFGGAVGAATRLRRKPAIGAGLVGGLVGGFAAWLVVNGMRDSVTPITSFAYWRSLAGDPTLGTEFLRHGAGAVLPAIGVPLGIAAVESMRGLWQR